MKNISMLWMSASLYWNYKLKFNVSYGVKHFDQGPPNNNNFETKKSEFVFDWTTIEQWDSLQAISTESFLKFCTDLDRMRNKQI